MTPHPGRRRLLAAAGALALGGLAGCASLGATGTAAAWDLRGLDALDHLGALTLWNHWGQQWPARLEVDDGQRALLERVAAYPAVAPARKRLGWAQRVDALGVRVLQSAAQVRDFVTLMGQLLLDFLRGLQAANA